MIGRIAKVRKRDGRLVDFDETRIADAIHKAACAVGGEDRFLAEELGGVVTLFLEKRYAGEVPGIEDIQDMVEKVLMETGHARMAKAYILYRERRARARARVAVEADAPSGPLVGSPAQARVSPWSKARIAEALVREADLDERVAADVAARVERRVFDSRVTRITTASIRSLVEAELLLMGYGDRVGRQALVGLPRYDLDRLVRTGKGIAWRPSGPRDLRTAVADAVLAPYALSEVYSAEVADAHLDARLHILDVGAPFEWVAASAEVPPADVDEWIESAALLALRLGGMVTREVALFGLASARGGAGGLAAARRLLGHAALRALEPHGGRFRLALGLRAFQDDRGDELVEATVREHWARFRAGEVAALPDLVLDVPAARVPEERGRRMLLPALAAAAETGRLLVALEREERPLPRTPWYRLPEAEPGSTGALPVAGAVAVNAGCLARGGDEAALVQALDEALVLALKALRQKRTLLSALQAEPGAPLYRVAGGPRPFVAGEGGLDLVHLVGVRAAAMRVLGDEAAASRLRGRLRAFAHVRLAEEGRRVRIRACLAPERDGEAALRFEERDKEGGSYRDLEPWPLPSGASLPRGEPLLEPVGETLVVRFPREEAPSPEALYDALAVLARDGRVRAVRLAPWPDRAVLVPTADV